jgi:long-chain acyl-CoA synthetase
VALVAPNAPEWGIWYLAITSMGAVVVPILTDFGPDDVARILDHAEPTAIITSPQTARLVTARTEPEIDLLSLAELTDSSAPDPEPPYPTLVGSPEWPGTEPEADTLAAIIYTSGTTGNPKGVMLSHRNLTANMVAARSLVDIGTKDRFLSVLPMAHTYECTIGFLVPFSCGATVTYLTGPPAISRLLPALAEVRPTMMLTVPLIMEKVYSGRVAPVLAKLPAWLAGLRPLQWLIHRIAARKVYAAFGGALHFYGIGGAPLSPNAERFMRDGRFPYAIGYGLTETAPLLAGTNARNTRFRSTGPAVPGIELRLGSVTTGIPLEPGVGEIQARGPSVMMGYYRNPDATAEVFTEDGWFRTGDLGSFGNDGYVFVRGRSKNLILGPSGENIYPEEIEAAIDADPLVEESLVLSRGAELVARVRLNVESLAERIGAAAESIDMETLRTQGEQILADLRERVNARLNRFSRLSVMVLQTEAFERTPTKKIKRYLYLREEA